MWMAYEMNGIISNFLFGRPQDSTTAIAQPSLPRETMPIFTTA